MMIPLLLVSSAWANDALETLPAKIAGTSGWPERQALVRDLLAAETDPDREARLDAAQTVLGALQAREPRVDRGRLRSLMSASVSADPLPRAEAHKAALLGVDLPEIPDGTAWFHRVPALPDGLPPVALTLTDLGDLDLDPASAQTLLIAHCTEIDWPIVAPNATEIALAGTVTDLYGAVWNDRYGFGVDVAWEVTRGDDVLYASVTRSFDPGPLDLLSPAVLLEGALFNLLAQEPLRTVLAAQAPDEADPGADAADAADETDAAPHEVDEDEAEAEESEAPVSEVDRELTHVPLGTLCLYRKKHADNRTLAVDVGGQPVPMSIATWGCFDVPEGMTVHSDGTPGAPMPIAAGQRQVVQVAHADAAGWAEVFPEDGATMDKLAGKGKITEVELLPAPATDP